MSLTAQLSSLTGARETDVWVDLLEAPDRLDPEERDEPLEDDESESLS